MYCGSLVGPLVLRAPPAARRSTGVLMTKSNNSSNSNSK